jgi:uncharacterized protein YigA (DUF484 family)/GGDEF domain-containing protein
MATDPDDLGELFAKSPSEPCAEQDELDLAQDRFPRLCDLDEYGEPDREDILKSFDLLFQLHQRSEDVRSHLESIDHLLLNSRTVAGLAGALTQSLAAHLDLRSVRLLFSRDHELHTPLLWETPEGVGFLPSGFFDREGRADAGPFILDDPTADTVFDLFGQDTFAISSAAIAPLRHEGKAFGLLCLGSADPLRYCVGMNTDVIATLAAKISLGLKNAADHEKRALEALMGPAEGVYGEVFFREALNREFDRAWRYGKVFSVMLIAVRSTDGGGLRAEGDAITALRRRIRSSDIVAEAEGAGLWALLPETDATGAQRLGERLAGLADQALAHVGPILFGVTEFSRMAASPSAIMAQARRALAHAETSGPRIVILPMGLTSSSNCSSSFL